MNNENNEQNDEIIMMFYESEQVRWKDEGPNIVTVSADGQLDIDGHADEISNDMIMV